mgnify:CR=1 FL=1
MQITNDGTFNTKGIKAAYKKLARKYHPDSINNLTHDDDKIRKRWRNLVKAYETLTKESKHRNYLLYGDPDGSVAVQALELAMPNWLLGSENHSKLVVLFFGGLILSVMALRIWTLSNEDKNESGISIDSKSSMKEYL